MAATSLLILVHGIEILPGQIGYQGIPREPGVWTNDDDHPAWCAIRTHDGRLFEIGEALRVGHLTHQSIDGSTVRADAVGFRILHPTRPLTGEERAAWFRWNYSRE